MEKLSVKLLRVGKADGYSTDGQIAHWCPACKELHPFAVETRNYSGGIWLWDGAVLRPTFSPSMHIKIGPVNANSPDRWDREIFVCHYLLRAGRIDYLGDCTHELVGKSIDIPDLPPKWPETMR